MCDQARLIEAAGGCVGRAEAAALNPNPHLDGKPLLPLRTRLRYLAH